MISTENSFGGATGMFAVDARIPVADLKKSQAWFNLEASSEVAALVA